MRSKIHSLIAFCCIQTNDKNARRTRFGFLFAREIADPASESREPEAENASSVSFTLGALKGFKSQSQGVTANREMASIVSHGTPPPHVHGAPPPHAHGTHKPLGERFGYLNSMISIGRSSRKPYFPLGFETKTSPMKH